MADVERLGEVDEEALRAAGRVEAHDDLSASATVTRILSFGKSGDGESGDAGSASCYKGGEEEGQGRGEGWR
jgi:hypothetical protein